MVQLSVLAVILMVLESIRRKNDLFSILIGILLICIGIFGLSMCLLKLYYKIKISYGII